MRIEKDWKIALQWIPSHCNIQGNEIADRIANEAHILQVIDDYPIETNEINKIVQTTANQKREKEWNEIKQTKALGKIKTEIGPWNHTRHKYRPIDVVLTRFRLNCTRLNKDLNQWKLINSPNCDQCNLKVPEDVEHVLLICPKYRENRLLLKQRLQKLGVIQFTLKNLLGGADTTEPIRKKINNEVGYFIKNTVRYKQL